jgi:hypothetical protein
LDPEDAQKLVRIAGSAKGRVGLRRAGMVLASLQGRSASEVAEMFWQNTKTWKHSRDPEFAVRKDRILVLYDHPPDDGRVSASMSSAC